MGEADFIQHALGNVGAVWQKPTLDSLASLLAPDGVLGRRRALLRSDIHEQWARWFVEGIVDPQRYAGRNVSYPYLFNDVLQVVDQRFRDFTRPERRELASNSARILQQLVRSLDSSRRRVAVSKADRSLLIDLAGDPPRCWVCGSRFSENAIDNFIFGENNEMSLPTFVDVLKPRGLKVRDFRVEIDHVVPYSRGGENDDNLQLACGWCNKSKSALISLYDVEGRPRVAAENALGLGSLPHPFWTVRLLAVERRCEHPDGCDRSADNSEVTVAPISKGGAMNPANLRVTCYEHDPMLNDRLQPSRIVRAIWGFQQ